MIFLFEEMKKPENPSAHFVVCLNNEGYKASLDRVIDESGEDYAFSADRFHRVDLPATVENALLAASR